VAGSNPPPRLREELEAAGVRLHADVADAALFARPMAIMIVPLFSGGGMRIKILEAMSLGKAVIATSIGAAGIDAEHGKNILVAEHAGAFAEAVAGLVADPSRARFIGAAGRQLVLARYTTDRVTSDLLPFYEQLLQGRDVSAGR
jgi:glycosyltransferase involved in cell wall biosynthesis